MNSNKIVVSFGTLDPVAFDKSYRILYDALNEKGYGLTLLNEKSSLVSGYPLLKDYLHEVSNGTPLTIFPLMLNEGNETFIIQELTKDHEVNIHEPLLCSEKNLILDYIKRTCPDKDKKYVLLGHGSYFNDNHLYYALEKDLPQNISLLLHHSETEICEKEIITVPLMTTCGRHIKAMNEELSSDHTVIPIQHGLLEDEIFRNELIKEIEAFLK